MTGTDGNNVAGVSYNVSGQLLTMNSESRSYNTMGQLTGINAGGASPVNMIYAYSSNQNNGKITSQTDNLTGENVIYAYDSLNRLIAAQAGGTWGQGFNYDPFGNLTAKTALAGSVPTLSVVPDPTTNRLYSVDSNGNIVTGPSGYLGYDAENRLVYAGVSYGQTYAYDSQNKRIWACSLSGDYSTCQTEIYYFYSPQGKLLAQYAPYDAPPSGGSTNPTLVLSLSGTRAYFGLRLLGNEDRVGSRGKYFPYGEARSGSQPDQVDFATYTRDSVTGMDYADQRYYASTWGRFLTPDPYRATGTSSSDAKTPQSWNRYGYVIGDPVNAYDPTGLIIDVPGEPGSPGCEINGEPFSLDPLCNPDPFGDPPPQPQKVASTSCSIALFSRGVPFGGSPAQHTYVELSETSGSGVTFLDDVLEGGPTNPHNPITNSHDSWGGLIGLIEPVALGSFLGGTDPATNTEIGSETGGLDVCHDIGRLLGSVNNYDAESLVSYAPRPNGSTTFNSNSFTFTLLFDIGLSSVFQPIGWSPGWGQVVPGLWP